jgi:hypothetical protein
MWPDCTRAWGQGYKTSGWATRTLKWLKKNESDYINVFEPDPLEWDYYVGVSAFVGETYYNVVFGVWKGDVFIRYYDEKHSYTNMNIEDFYELIKKQ